METQHLKTEKLYTKDVYLRQCESTILEITQQTRKKGTPPVPALIFDQTLFFPEGGGQPCDIGTVNGLPIYDVQEEAGLIYHFIETDDDAATSCGPTPLQLLKVGQKVQLSLDWDRRFRHMQRHCGEHILSGIFFQETGGVNRGFHMGDSYMTIDIDVQEISGEQILKIERLANEVIWSNKPVITRHFDQKAEAEHLPLRKPLAIEEDITIVCVGDPANPADCVACCGTHPAHAGEVGLIKILKTEHYKGMMRIYLKAGQEALADYDQKHELVTALNNKYSADTSDLLSKIRIQEEKNKGIRQELYELKQFVLSLYTQELLSHYHALAAAAKHADSAQKSSVPVLVKEYSPLKIDDLLNLGRKITDEITGLLLLTSASEHTVLLFSNGHPDCGKLVKENAPIYHGKGGGNAKNARALFSKREYLDTFIDLLEKHLR